MIAIKVIIKGEFNLEKTRKLIIPCCGIDSIYGLLSQEVAFSLLKERDQLEIVGLAFLVTGNIEAEESLGDGQCLVINGCEKRCASHVVDFIGGDILCEATISSLVSDYGLKSLGTGMQLSDSGCQLVQYLTDRFLKDITEIQERGDE